MDEKIKLEAYVARQTGDRQARLDLVRGYLSVGARLLTDELLEAAIGFPVRALGWLVLHRLPGRVHGVLFCPPCCSWWSAG